MFERLRSDVAGETGLVFGGTLASGLLNFGAILIAIRGLGPETFGRLALLTAVMTLTAQFLDFGMSTTFVKFTAQRLRTDPARADLTLQVTFFARAALGVLLLFAAALASGPVAARFLDDVSLAPLLFLALVGSAGTLLWEFCRGTLQARQRFRLLALVTPVRNVFKLAALVALVALDSLDLAPVVAATAAAPFVGFFIGWALIPRGFLRARGARRPVLREIYRFTRWVTLSSLATMFIMRIDLFMLQGISSEAQVGFYAGANQLAYLFPLITGSITTVLLPRVSRLEGLDELRAYAGRILRLAPVVPLLFVPLLIVAPALIPFLMGAAYVPSVPVFRVLILSFAVSVVANPVGLIFYNRDRADLLAWLNVIQLVAAVLLNLWLIPPYGAVGAALGSLCVRLFGGAWILLFARRLLRAVAGREGA